MSKLGPVDYQWDEKAEVMRPLKRYLTQMHESCIHGAVYRLEPSRRSQKQHNFQFREIDIAWHNLPEELQERFPSSEHLRKWALCKAGYCNRTESVFESEEKAREVERMILRFEQYAVVEVRGNVLIAMLAWSQNKKAMGGTLFAESLDAVLDVIANLLGTTAEALKRATLEAA
jgi:hypothetical protein